jgi:hypothetical protein
MREADSTAARRNWASRHGAIGSFESNLRNEGRLTGPDGLAAEYVGVEAA